MDVNNRRVAHAFPFSFSVRLPVLDPPLHRPTLSASEKDLNCSSVACSYTPPFFPFPSPFLTPPHPPPRVARRPAASCDR